VQSNGHIHPGAGFTAFGQAVVPGFAKEDDAECAGDAQGRYRAHKCQQDGGQYQREFFPQTDVCVVKQCAVHQKFAGETVEGRQT
jgi:hypothetical protein